METKYGLYIDGQQITEFPFETTDFRGDKVTVTAFTPGRHTGSEGRIITDSGHGYFPSIIKAEIRELCPACGSPMPVGQSCGCFDNGSE